MVRVMKTDLFLTTCYVRKFPKSLSLYDIFIFWWKRERREKEGRVFHSMSALILADFYFHFLYHFWNGVINIVYHYITIYLSQCSVIRSLTPFLCKAKDRGLETVHNRSHLCGHSFPWPTLNGYLEAHFAKHRVPRSEYPGRVVYLIVS